MEQKKYSVEQFKMNFVKPTLDRECKMRFMKYFHNARIIFQITFRRYPSESTSKQSLITNRALMIKKFTFSEWGCVRIKPLRGRSRNGAHSFLMTRIRFFDKKRIKAKNFIQRRQSHNVELLCGISMPRETVHSRFGEYQILK